MGVISSIMLPKATFAPSIGCPASSVMMPEICTLHSPIIQHPVIIVETMINNAQFKYLVFIIVTQRPDCCARVTASQRIQCWAFSFWLYLSDSLEDLRDVAESFIQFRIEITRVRALVSFVEQAMKGFLLGLGAEV